jgi:serine/threonine protein kinase
VSQAEPGLSELQWDAVFSAARQCAGMTREQTRAWLATQPWNEAMRAAFCIHVDLGEPPDDPTRLRSGERIGPAIELRAHLRDGGAGSVYLGVHESAGRFTPVAVKLLLLPDHEHGRLALKEAWLRERRWLAELRGSARVAPLVEAGEHTGPDGTHYLYLCTEYKHGFTLRRFCEEHALATPDRVALFLQVCDAVAALHAHGLVHGDLKPDNVQVQAYAGQASVWLLDLGLTALQGQTWPGQGQLLGTPGYMAPEQIDERQGTIGAATDVYALGLILFELLEGRPWLDARGVTTPSELEARIRAAPPPRLTRGASDYARLRLGARAEVLAPALRERLNRVLERATAREAGARFQQVSVLRQALEQASASAEHRQRTRRRVLGSLLLAGVLGGVAIGGLRSAAPRACADLDAPMNAIWNAGTRERLQTAFRGTGLPFAGDAFRAADVALTGYAHAWTAARTDACEATHVRGEQSGELMDLRMACLARRRAEIGELVTALLTPDADAVARSLEAARRLPALDECADTDALLARLPLPSAPEARAAVDALDAELVHVKSFTDVGRYREALPLAGAALERARELAYAPAIAEAHYWLGRLRGANDDEPGARAALAQAVLYADAGRDDRLRLDAYLELIALDDGLLASADAIALAIEHAEQLLVRIGSPARARARLHDARSISAHRRGRYAVATTQAEQALAVRREHLPPNDPEIADTLYIYSYPLVDSGRRTQARDALNEALAIARASLGDRHPRIGDMLLRASLSYTLLDQNREALAAAEEALALFGAVYGERHSSTAGAWLAIASAHWRSGRFEDALAAGQKGLALVRDVEGRGSVIEARLSTNHSLILKSLNRFDEAEAAARHAVDGYTRTRGPDHPDTGAAVGRVAAVLGDRADRAAPGSAAQAGDRRLAISLYERSIAILRKTSPDHPRLLDQIRGIAYVYESLGQPSAAVPWLEEGLRIRERSEESPLYTGYLLFAAGRVFWAADHDRPRAERLALEAQVLFRNMGRSDQVDAVDAWLTQRNPR